MNARSALYVQAIRGPVLLVSLGVLFAMHQAGVLSFARTWPLLVIVIGVMKLLERTWAPVSATPGNYRNPGPYPYTQPASYTQPPPPPPSGSFQQPNPNAPPRTPGGNNS
jgi:hypothetical protein